MEFSRDEKNRIRCVITEEEIENLGYSMEDIVSNGTRAQEFMNRIFDMAEDELQIKFGVGIKTVRADLLPDHTLTLTFSEHPSTEGLLEHLKEVVSGLVHALPQPQSDEPAIIILVAFEEMDTMIRFAKQVPSKMPVFNDLYKFEDTYFLMMDLSQLQETEVKKLSAVIDEYATDVFAGSEKRAFIYEHGKVVIKEYAIETLRQV